MVTLEVPHAGRRAWHWVAPEFDERLAAQVILPVLAADFVAEVCHGRDGLRLRIAVTVRAADVGQAVTRAREGLEAASDVGGFDLVGATARRPGSINSQPLPRFDRSSSATTLVAVQDRAAPAAVSRLRVGPGGASWPEPPVFM